MTKAFKAGDSAFSPVVILTLVIVGVFTFTAYIVLSAYAPALRDGNDGGVHALSKSATGFAALNSLLRKVGKPTVIQRNTSSEATEGIIVFTPPTFGALDPERALDPYQISAVILPKWRTGADPFRKGWVRKLGIISDTEFALSLGEQEYAIAVQRREKAKHVFLKAADAFGGAIVGGRSTGPLGSFDQLQFFEPSETIEPILVADDGAIIVGKLKDAPVI